MNRILALLIACTLLVSTLGATGVAADGTAYVTVSKVSVDPRPPSPGDEFTVRVTLASLERSIDNYDIDRVELRTGPDENGTLDRLDVVGPSTLAPGRSKTVELTATIDSVGVHRLRVHVFGHEADGDALNLQYPFDVRVDDEHPQLDVAVADPIAESDVGVNVTVANGLAEDLRNVEVTLDGDGLSVDNPKRVRSLLATGQEAHLGFTAVADETGTQPIVATLRYTDADGNRRTVSERTQVRFAALTDRVELDASAAPDGSALAVTVTNLGNVPLEHVRIGADAADVTASKALVESVAPQSSRTVQLNVSDVRAEGRVEVPIVATYDVGARTGRAETTANVASNPGEITLTGVELEREGDIIHLTGSASNVGLSETNSVIVRVVPAEGVVPAQPNKEYFVGTVPASDFVSFDVFARVDENVSEIPLEVTYLVDGERHTRAVAIDQDLTPVASPEQSDGGGFLVPALVGGVVVLVVGAIVAVAWRNSRGGD